MGHRPCARGGRAKHQQRVFGGGARHAARRPPMHVVDSWAVCWLTTLGLPHWPPSPASRSSARPASLRLLRVPALFVSALLSGGPLNRDGFNVCRILAVLP